MPKPQPPARRARPKPSGGTKSDSKALQLTREIALIHAVQADLASGLDFDAIITNVGDRLHTMFDVSAVQISTYDPAANLLHIHYCMEDGVRHSHQPEPPFLFRERAVRTGATVVVNEHLSDVARAALPPPGGFQGKIPKSAVWVPLLFKGQVTGIVSLQDSRREQAFPQSTVQVVETIARSMSLALENIRLVGQLRLSNAERGEALDQQTATSNILRVIAESPADVQPVLDAVAAQGARLSESAECAIFQLTSPTHITLAAQAGPDRAYPIGSVWPLEGSMVGACIREKRMLHVPDIQETGTLYPVSKSVQTQYRSFLALPLIRERECSGAIFIRRPQAGPFSQKQIDLVTTFADQAAIAIENVRLFSETQRLLDETERRAAELAVINAVQQGLASRLEFKEITDLVGDTIRGTLRVQGVSIGLYDHASQTVNYSYAVQKGNRVDFAPISMSGISRHVIESRQALTLNDSVQERVDALGSHWGMEEAPKSLVCVPLVSGNAVLGEVAIYDYERENAFTKSDVQLLQTLCHAMSLALENAQLWHAERQYRKGLERELEIGREIQAGFLPDSLPQAPGWDISALLMPAREVAGDFYDAFALPDGKLALVVADVCDKGVGAALFMTLFRSLIRVVTQEEYAEAAVDSERSVDVADVLQRAVQLTNDYIANTHGESGMFATLYFGILDPRDGRLAYINAGHEPPLIVAGGKIQHSLARTGPAVGAISAVHFDVHDIQLQSGATLVAFTDGVPDCKNASGDFFGHERLLTLLQDERIPATPLLGRLKSELRSFIGEATQFDDITILAVTGT